MFLQNIESKILSENAAPTPTWIYWMIIISGILLGATSAICGFFDVYNPQGFFLLSGSLCLMSISMGMMNTVLRSRTAPAMWAGLAYTFFCGLIIVAICAVATIVVAVIVAIVVFIWVGIKVLSIATAEERTVKKSSFLFGDTEEKVYGHSNLDGSFTGLDGKKYKEID